MKTRVVLALMLLALFLSGAGIVNAKGLDTLARQSGDEAPTCLGLRLVGEFDYEILADSSSLGMNGDAVQSVVCNYRMSTRAAHPAGPGQISGMAITINYACPAETESSWKSRTDDRPDAISRTSNSVLLRETGEFSSFTGDHTIQEKMFLLIDTHTSATIVVNTDPLPGTTDSPIYSAVTAQPIATDLATLYAARANDPECGLPPIAGGSGTSSPGGVTQIEGPGHNPWQHIPGNSAVAVAVSTGAIVVLAVGGLVTGAGGLGLGGSVPAGSSTVSASQLPVAIGPTPLAPPSPASMDPVSAGDLQDIEATGVGPPQEAVATDNTQGFAPVDSTQQQSATITRHELPAMDSAPQVVEPVAPSIPSIIQPVVEAAETVLVVGGVGAAVAQAGSMARSDTTTAQDDQSEESEDDAETEKRCPEAEAYLFGLPAINGRSDCPGIRNGMGPWCAGIDFTSKDEHGMVSNLEFDASVAGVVTYVGGPFNMIEIKRENGNRIQFLHASEVYVVVGNEVEANTKLGKTGGTGPEGFDQYEIHLHIQAIDEQGNMIDPDCAISGGENRELKIKGPESPYRERLESEQDAGRGARDTHLEVIPMAEDNTSSEPLGAVPAVEATEAMPAVEAVSAVEVVPAVESVPVPAVEAAPATTIPSNEPKQCSNCGQMNPPTAKFCSSCGQRFAEG